jgi:Fic family protein
MVSRIYWSLSLSGNPLTKTDIENLIIKTYPVFLTDSKTKKLTSDEKRVIRYKKVHDLITHEWLVNPQPLRLKDALAFAEIIETKQVKSEQVDLSILFEYLHKSTEHPVVQAAIVQMQLICLHPFQDGNGRLARLLSLLYLYKNGYDFRGMLTIEEYWRKDLASLDVIKDTVLQSNSLNMWLEYYASSMVGNLEKSLQKIRGLAFHSEKGGNWELSDRQRNIISVLEFPHATITNKKVQKHFKVSQITASRDLTRLLSLGMVLSHGKGRSTYYTRV